jgi:phage terminase large subunit
MDWRATTIYEQNLEAYLDGKRHIWNEGGTSSSKTWSILQILILIAKHAKSPMLISIVSESIPHIKRGAIRDFVNIMGDDFDVGRFNKSDYIYDFGKAKVEFFSADMPDKLRGARRDILFINEANNVPYNAFRELDIRTRKACFCDWNPVSEFWFHEGNLANKPDSAYIHSTYLDAIDVIPPEVVANIEANKDDVNWFNIYGLGMLGKIEGLVYPSFLQIDELPPGNFFYGLDFGYSNDPTALVKCVIIGDSLYCQELIYQTGLTNQDVAGRMEALGIKPHYDEIFADSAEPKSIEEIYRYGYNIKGCPKGADSVEYGHQRIRQFKQFWTKSSLNGIKEQRNFKYIEDKNGRLTDKTTHLFSHLLDARRYAVIGMTQPKEQERIIFYDAMREVEGLIF